MSMEFMTVASFVITLLTIGVAVGKFVAKAEKHFDETHSKSSDNEKTTASSRED